VADSSRISPTAHYTGWVWYRNRMSHPALATPLGRVLHGALRPLNVAWERLGSRPSLDMMLLARHRVIDLLLERAIAAGEVGQVIEVAAGLSPRGLRFAGRHPTLRYLEADLPEMAAHKRRVLTGAGVLGARHEVVEIDALADAGPSSLDALAARLDPALGTAIVTEGLLGYFDTPSVEGMWRRFARALGRFPAGLYLSDFHVGDDVGGMRSARYFRVLLSAFARGKVYTHYRSAADAEQALRAAGFASARLHRPADHAHEVEIPGAERGHVVRLIEARTAPPRRAA